MIPIRRSVGVALSWAVIAGSFQAGGARGANFDHIVVVMEENSSFSQVMGSVDAPYINALAAGGVTFSNSYSITHPSQPNYLQLFSGDDQGIKDDTSATSVFITPNLAAAVTAAGKSFVGYSESMPSVGYTGDEYSTDATNQYKRKHNPWVNWQSATPTGNQLAASVNQPFTSFPTAANYASLPTVSFVVPNEQNDMHDGTIAQADTWLSNNLSAYAAWAKSNNSLLVITFDEDNSSSNNHIPTIFYGANLRDGTTLAATYTSHDLLATLASFTSASAPGLGANAKPIYGAVLGQKTPARLTFQQGVVGYSGTLTNNLRADSATTAHPGLASVVVDGDTLSGTPAQLLVKFDSILGSGTTQVPLGATILSAKLIFQTDIAAPNPFSGDTFKLYRMITPWDGTSTWNSMTGGLSADGTKAASAEDFEVLPYAGTNELAIFDVTDTVQFWANGGTNNGWFMTDANGTDGWRFFGESGSATPLLEIVFVPEPASLGFVALGALMLLRRRR